ncbi:MAG TPA: hypothetical protein EYG03_08985 [Planctomycetes bacterium]|nr:hypothetical protein [Fuerstiella sp.]HIK92098.1 hypothetical protein [Planctomycetota bacterium]
MTDDMDIYAAEHNPFQAPRAWFDNDWPADHPEAIRRKYLSHEASAKSIGTLHLCGGLVCILISIGLWFVQMQPSSLNGPIVVSAVVGVAMFFLAVSANRLKRWSRFPSAVLAVAVGLAAFIVGIPIAVYFLYVMFGANGQMVYSDEYREIIKQTPHIKYRTPAIAWTVLLLLIGLIGLGVAASVFGP